MHDHLVTGNFSIGDYWPYGDASLSVVVLESFTSQKQEESHHEFFVLKEEQFWRKYSQGIWRCDRVLVSGGPGNLAHICCDKRLAVASRTWRLLMKSKRDVQNAMLAPFGMFLISTSPLMWETASCNSVTELTECSTSRTWLSC